MPLIYEAKTAYGNIEVVDDEHGIVRTLFVDGVSQGRWNRGTQGPQSWYMQEICEKVSYYDEPIPSRALVLGGGAGIITTELERYGILTDTVEINPAMVEVAENFFRFAPKGKVIVGNAFSILRGLAEYDVIVHDLYNGIVPAVGPDSFFEECLNHLKPNGHFLSNVVMLNLQQVIVEVSTDGKKGRRQTPSEVGDVESLH